MPDGDFLHAMGLAKDVNIRRHGPHKGTTYDQLKPHLLHLRGEHIRPIRVATVDAEQSVVRLVLCRQEGDLFLTSFKLRLQGSAVGE
jgi:hypothetical protein